MGSRRYGWITTLFIKISEMPVGKPLRLQKYDREADPRQGLWFISKNSLGSETQRVLELQPWLHCVNYPSSRRMDVSKPSRHTAL